MAKQKRQNGFVTFSMWLISLLAGLAIGGLFASGTLTNVAILKWLPLLIHQIAGWFIIIVTLGGAVILAYKLIKKML